MTLKRIHSRQPANPGLIEFNRFPTFGAAFNQIQQFTAALEEAFAMVDEVDLDRFVHSA
ncbi:hypothetical protein [Pelagibius litoralis]|uniref:hypothetical protein n=1 Tax=Pelagibius litoralis TaxID=374515 RepID=UPI002AC32A7E|nr:hypothetical protein [Pelagibius litoralis]